MLQQSREPGAPLTGFLAAEVGSVELNLAIKSMGAVVLGHGTHGLVVNKPSCAVLSKRVHAVSEVWRRPSW